MELHPTHLVPNVPMTLLENKFLFLVSASQGYTRDPHCLCDKEHFTSIYSPEGGKRLHNSLARHNKGIQ